MDLVGASIECDLMSSTQPPAKAPSPSQREPAPSDPSLEGSPQIVIGAVDEEEDPDAPLEGAVGGLPPQYSQMEEQLSESERERKRLHQVLNEFSSNEIN